MDFLYIVSREMKCLVCFSGGVGVVSFLFLGVWVLLLLETLILVRRKERKKERNLKHSPCTGQI